MKNLMSRDEYLQKANEGFIKDTIKKGWEKVKSLFKIGMKKIKDFIAIFDSNGNVFPVVSPCAVMDKFSDSNAIKMYAPHAVSQVAVAAGGNGCEERAELNSDEEIYNYGPDGKEYATWMKEGKYKETPEYKNFLTLGSVLNESKNVDDLYIIDESWDAVKKERNKYSFDESFGNTVKAIDHLKFEEWIEKFIDQRINKGGKTIVRHEEGGVNRVAQPERNMLVFGAPGIGKSTIPNTVIKKYNEDVAKGDPAKMISLINVNCALLKAGDFLMPTMPKEEEITKNLKRFANVFPEASKYLDDLSDDEQEAISAMIKNTGQFKSSDAPKSWLPSYKSIGGDIDKLLDSYANGGTVEDEDGFAVKTGNGGIIIFDEFLRADPDVFGELMNFLLYRKIHDWKLGSKWVIIACSNRPCDDDNISNIWSEWNGSPAMKGRFSRIFQLIPDPDDWKKWAKSKGCDDIILDFIFEKSSKEGNEYPRWHTEVKNGSGESQQTIPINPRQWETAINAINTYIIDNNYPNILKMTAHEIEDVLEGIFDTDFISEFTMWFEDHKNKIDIDMIMSDPKYLKLDKKVVDDSVQANTVIESVITALVDRYKEDPSKLKDEKLANVAAWIGINFPSDVELALKFIRGISKDVCKDKEEYSMDTFVKTMMTFEAAYPPKDIDTDIDKFQSRSNEKTRWPENSLELIKDIINEFFPWRLEGDEIQYYNKLKALK